MTEREQHDYRAMLADLQAHPNEQRTVWRRPLTPKTARQAAAVAEGLRGFIKYPHRDGHGRIACRREGCEPFHKGEGGASSKSDKDAGEAVVVGKWVVIEPGVGEMTAEDVLTVLNDLEPVDLSKWTFCVLTDAPDGNFSPFERGEVLVLDEHRQEVGHGRRPAKVDVAEQDFATLAEALACREQVLAGTWPRSYA